MTEQNPNPDIADDDTEGHARARAAADDPRRADEMADDVEGHTRRPAMDSSDDEDDVEGHFRKPR